MSLYPVSISLSSYGATLVRARGQAWFIDLLADANASHIELREELGLPADLPALATAIRSRNLHCVYSSPLQLWAEHGQLDARVLSQALAAAQSCGARWLKVSLGHYQAGLDLLPLRALLLKQPVRLLVENDQTPQGGRIAALADFFSAAQHSDVPVAMTLDIGNWQWQAQSVFDAVAQLGQYVEYVHCKGVQRSSTGKLLATPPTVGDLHVFDQVLQRVVPGVMRAIEFPLEGEDLCAITTAHVAQLGQLGAPRQQTLREACAHV